MTTDTEVVPCPVCGLIGIEGSGHYDICRRCHWEDEPVPLDGPSMANGGVTPRMAMAQWSVSHTQLRGDVEFPHGVVECMDTLERIQGYLKEVENLEGSIVEAKAEYVALDAAIDAVLDQLQEGDTPDYDEFERCNAALAKYSKLWARDMLQGLNPEV